MSIVFDARKNADRSKRAREAVARASQSPGGAPESGDPQNVNASVNASNGPAQPATKLNHALTEAAAKGTGAAAAVAGSPETSSRSGVDLKAERRTTDWRLRWNRNCAVNAIRGRLWIEDGGAHKQLNLDIAELRTGSIVYAPVTNEVFFRLEIIRPAPEEALSESVRVVAGGSAERSLPEQKLRAPLADRNGVARIARSNGAWAPGMKMTPETGMRKEAAQEEGPLVRSLLRTPYSQEISSVAGASLPVASLPGASIRGYYLSGEDLAEGDDEIEPAVLIVRSDPVYPAIARRSHISGSVEVQFRISSEGRVYDVKSVKGWPILAKAAIDAVATWRYEPARRNGIPVDSQMRTNFDFQLS